jgi:hypothetical protein
MNRLSMGELGKRSDPLWEEAQQASVQLDTLEKDNKFFSAMSVEWRNKAEKLEADLTIQDKQITAISERCGNYAEQNVQLRIELIDARLVIQKLHDERCLDVDGYCIYNEYKERLNKKDIKVQLTHCKYCGAKLTRDCVGLRCPTHNCQWEWGIPDKET